MPQPWDLAKEVQLEMWTISDALPLEAARAPSPSARQVSLQSSDAQLSYCDFTDFPPRAQRTLVVGANVRASGSPKVIGNITIP